MIPDLPNLSNPVMQAEFLPPYNREKLPLLDYARGGIGLLDASKGLNLKNWTCELQEGEIFLSAEGVAAAPVLTVDPDADWVSLAFDQNMHFNLTYTIRRNTFLHWYDADRQGYVTDSFGDVKTPFIRMDDVRDFTEGTNDIVFSYIRQGHLCVRMQRDRFKIEYVLARNAGSAISQCGMNRILRFQWYTQ